MVISFSKNDSFGQFFFSVHFLFQCIFGIPGLASFLTHHQSQLIFIGLPFCFFLLFYFAAVGSWSARLHFSVSFGLNFEITFSNFSSSSSLWAWRFLPFGILFYLFLSNQVFCKDLQRKALLCYFRLLIFLIILPQLFLLSHNFFLGVFLLIFCFHIIRFRTLATLICINFVWN